MFRRAEARWQQRWDARATPPTRRLSSSSCIDLPGHSPVKVWAFLRSIQFAVLLGDNVTRAFIVPGTGPGVGEQRCALVLEDGRETPHIVTVTAEEPERLVETTSHAVVDQGARYELQPTDGGTRYSLTMWMDVAEEAPRKAIRECESLLESHVSQHVQRVKALLDAGAVPAT